MKRLEIVLMLLKRKTPNLTYEQYAEKISSIFDIQVTANELRRMEEPTAQEESIDKQIHMRTLWL